MTKDEIVYSTSDNEVKEDGDEVLGLGLVRNADGTIEIAEWLL